MHKTNWQKIYLDYSPKLLGICRRYVADLQTAEDLLQDSFILAMQKSHQLKDEKALFGWLKTIVVNSALQHLRSNSKEIFVSTEISEIPEQLTEMNNSSTEKNHVLAYDFTREELLKSIDSLPLHHRSVFNLYFIENNSHQEIAKLLGINVNTSKSHLLRAKKSVQNYLLNNFVTQDTPKNNKKVTQLLVFLGFGSLMWAQTFQSKFADFKITPSKNLSIPNNVSSTTVSFSGPGKNLLKKLIITATLFITLIISIVAFEENKSFKQGISLAESTMKNEIENNVNKNSTEPKSEVIKKTDIQNEELNKIDLNRKTENQENISRPILTKEKKLHSKDSVDNALKKVIIIKKIIQRDTIFIERPN
ncbi:RNA polymerase sigma factor [Chryseobacterium wangxinyae]|uniref:RNA polymerase sigma factor n=1 Tax=Chryseobacterium sp. CY350 TaxID=2997336 RepID=UPI00226FEAE1|nr:RNA polymerase sigma factor [Chryseobacterium sp. CY350]MCY0978117.1 RNA polymerase sigma factor [Chryseobacterium sp. CY350]WBZ95201.1 RNA polymerase sigma factor [Chryseobacterium sp. CY350]